MKEVLYPVEVGIIRISSGEPGKSSKELGAAF